MRAIAGGLAAVAVLAAAEAPLGARDPVASLPFRLLGSADIVVPVMLAGRGPFPFLLDTGSTRTAVSTRLADALGLAPAGRTRVITPAGESAQPIVRVPSIGVGPVVAAEVAAMLLTPAQLGHGRVVEGLLGFDVLGGRTFRIDYERRHLSWPAEAVDAAGRLALDVEGGRLLVTLPQDASADPLALVPDTGADGLVLFARPGRVLPSHAALAITAVRGVSGRRMARRVLIDRLVVGGTRLHAVPGVVVDRPGVRVLGDGLLPLHLFARVTVSGPGRYLVVEPR